MIYYTSKQVREILGLSRSIVARLIDAGFVMPERGPRRERRFTFQDLVVLRAAKGLADARLRISVSLKKLRQQLPTELPATGLRIAAVVRSWLRKARPNGAPPTGHTCSRSKSSRPKAIPSSSSK